MATRMCELVLGNENVFIAINSLDGDCIFISPCSSKSFQACQYDEVEGDRIYFIDGGLNAAKHAPPLDNFVYNTRDGTMGLFAADLSEDKLRAPGGMLMNPTWLFPSNE
ncbi:hypothetical protein PR202_gb12994 [Eleusine coracana subsp. coracana]|uniref:KIB1-4 beta-propeller domain-containing protein n=1 Tax=Eleusine coracana subsp. coracana TaxID=191504 RepID=A0AAV5ERJ5_ELECO|nr:hypothetical protein PR202_gb12994 [Eleusine coracana subsp. coracana]